MVVTPERTSSPPQIPGFRDYYSAVASTYRLRRYSGFTDVIASDGHPKVFLHLWKHLAKAEARFHRVPGKHPQMIERDRLPILADALLDALEGARSRSENVCVADEAVGFMQLRSSHPELCMENERA